jgi:tRNA modification GTPase
LAALLKGEHVGSIFQRGVVVAIVGKANVGKSSLLNSLLKEEKALVTEVPGTTRDAIEGQINLEGIPFRLIDTAGIRKTGDRVEILGVERSKNKVQEAQIALIVLDGSQDLDEQDLEIITLTKGKARLFAINKADLGVKIALDDPALYGEIVVVLSAKTREGLKELEKEMIALVVGEEGLSSGDAVLLNLRQRSHLQNANQVIGEAISALEKKEGEEIAALLLREALGHLDSITGKNFQKDLVDSIFSRFCIGK